MEVKLLKKDLLVVLAIVGRSELAVDEVDGGDGEENVDHFHAGVVDGNVAREKVQVAGQKDDKEEKLKI